MRFCEEHRIKFLEKNFNFFLLSYSDLLRENLQVPLVEFNGKRHSLRFLKVDEFFGTPNFLKPVPLIKKNPAFGKAG